MEKRKLEINEENVRLDKFIMNSISDLSRTLIQEYIKEGLLKSRFLIIRRWMFYQKIFL